MRVGLAISILDGNNNLIGTGFADNAEVVSRGTCRISALIEDVPEVAFYQIQPGGRGAPSYSLQDMQEADWVVALEIGS